MLRSSRRLCKVSQKAFVNLEAHLKSQLIYFTIYHLYFNPLSKYPGPFWAKISSWPSFYHAIKRDRHIWIWQCFQIYGITSILELCQNTQLLIVCLRADTPEGSKVRLTPNTVLFNTPRAYRDIYNYKANVKKNKTYDAWRRNEGDANTLNVTDVAIHAQKRRLLNTVFTERSVRSAAVFIIKHLDRWNELTVSGEDWSEPTDLTKWTDCLVFDILGDLCFGKSFDIKEPGENPFKVMPEAIISYMKFWHPVRSSFLHQECYSYIF